MDRSFLKDENLYYIGGIVRDELLGVDSSDTDITYVGNAIEFAKSHPELNILQINEPFGTVKVEFSGEEIDIASTRDELYPQKGHLPIVQNIGTTLETDVKRRDFTVNALAKSTKTGDIVDYVGGLNDLKNKELRVLHNKSFIDDPTRIVRGLNFYIRFNFELEEHTKKLQEDYLNNVNYDMSYKRLKKELVKTFNLNSQIAFEKFINDKIYKLLTPKDFTLPTINLENLIKLYNVNNIWIIYIGLLPDVEKLPLTKIELKIVEDYRKLQNLSYNSDFEIYNSFNQVELESAIMFATKNYTIVDRYLTVLRNVKLEITGQDLLDIGIKPSKKYKECFDYILTKKLEKPNMTKSEELEIAKKFFE